MAWQPIGCKAEPSPWILCLSGGGVKFIGLVGAIVALMDAGYSFQRVSGVSAGSVVASILAAASQGDQLTGEEVKELALSVPLRNGATRDPFPISVPRGGWCGTAACTAVTSPTTGFAAS